MSSAPPTIPSIVKTVTVSLAPERAFALFTDGIGRWWPLAEHSVGGTASQGVRMTPEAVVETLPDGSTTVWAEVTGWDPPRRFALSWHPGQDAGPDSTDVVVTFEPTGDGTLVTLEHSGWERVPPSRRESYDSGWTFVLDAFRAAA